MMYSEIWIVTQIKISFPNVPTSTEKHVVFFRIVNNTHQKRMKMTPQTYHQSGEEQTLPIDRYIFEIA